LVWAFALRRSWRDERERHERLSAKAQTKLDHLAEESKVSDPAVLAVKRTVIEAALARSRARKS